MPDERRHEKAERQRDEKIAFVKPAGGVHAREVQPKLIGWPKNGGD